MINITNYKKLIILILSSILSLVFIGCTTMNENNLDNNTTLATSKQELTVAAASDLTKAFTEIGIAFDKAHNSSITFSFGSTGNLSEQIANGAPFDVFAAANESIINDLDTKGFIVSDTKSLYGLGRIGIATLKDSSFETSTLDDLLNPDIKIIAMANPDHAPYGLASKQAIVSAGLWDKLEPKIVYGKNISEAMTFITTGNADAGFIALSLKDDSILNFNIIDSNMHNPLNQAIAVVKASNKQDLAREFINYVNSSDGQAIMSKYGFIPPEE
ncbi:molybdate ABC transporter substrate-binding protein [Alkalibaculum sp. M08DMB]|uniref:Molybdate ABC transporter substrate-binding protein n=1 Tax=Alkalibaculum sporogenes TaxID=2655001 RepID=A0A6A7K4R4_9FIRM|nr:molybdate ABC transporter substrate-binding protein [Alkalibaculum sporogenes]MPW24449.1 molybdate ABC transporter substrate-binding protein [Alkalibaculum sporogenes]